MKFHLILKCRFVDEHYSSLEPLFEADPLLLYDFIYLCHKREYITLFKKIPTYLSLTWLCSLANQKELDVSCT